MLRAQFENSSHADNDVLEVGILERLALPFMFGLLRAPELAGHLSDALFPATKDTHAFV